MGINKEIERKWLIDKSKIPFDLSAAKPLRMQQSYISFSPTVRLRATNGESFVLCIKSKPKELTMARDEFELELTEGEYNHMLSKIEGKVIEKTRYCIKDPHGYVMEFDIFSGSLDGLAYMEIEFPSEQEAAAYPNPPWAIKDVTFDHRYKNASLAKNGMPEDYSLSANQ